jgi:nitroimidazol reductase NimA-like FMN-containing flavoprotein (pyridoxamine 5'-phosphate oxidase superfamily)
MDNQNDPVMTLGDSGMWSLLTSTALGRLGVSAGGELDIFPVNYIVDEKTILFRTAEGTKLVELTARANVVFEIDGHTEHDAWSVVVKGTAARLDRQLDIDRADTLALSPWIPTFKYVYVRVTPTSLSGRRFRRGPEPDRQAF